MKLMTKAIEAKMPPLYANEEKGTEDTPVIVKFFDAFGSWSWYATEGDKLDNGDWEFFGWVNGTYPELGYFMLSELESLKMGPAPRIERDKYFGACSLKDVMEGAVR